MSSRQILLQQALTWDLPALVSVWLAGQTVKYKFLTRHCVWSTAHANDEGLSIESEF